MDTPSVRHTQINAPDLRQQLQAIKSDGKDNAVTVNPQTGDVTVYTFDTVMPTDFAKGLAAKQVVFVDPGSDDAQATLPEQNRFFGEVLMAGKPYDPTAHIQQLRHELFQARQNLQADLGQLNVRGHIESQIDRLEQALEKQDPESMKQAGTALLNSSKQLFFGRFYLPDFGMMSLNRPEPNLAAKVAESAHKAQWIAKHMAPTEPDIR